jgi:hypothetical protein
MKQTAVEWLVQVVQEANLLENNGWILPLIQQAKKMEKQQIMEAYDDGQAIPPFDYAEKYYNETYKKNNL